MAKSVSKTRSTANHPSLSKSEKRRLTMLHAAINGLAEDGLEGANFERVARQLNVRRSHVVYYFKDRDELILAAVKYIVTIAQELTAADVDAASGMTEKILAINSATFRWADKLKDHARALVVFYALCANSASFRRFNTQLRVHGTQRVLTIFKDYNYSGTETELLHKAQTIQGIIMGFVIEYMASNSVADCKKLSAQQIARVLE